MWWWVVEVVGWVVGVGVVGLGVVGLMVGWRWWVVGVVEWVVGVVGWMGVGGEGGEGALMRVTADNQLVMKSKSEEFHFGGSYAEIFLSNNE